MAITFVKNHGAAADNVAATTLTLAATSDIPAGNLLVFGICYDNDFALSSIADVPGNTYAEAFDNVQVNTRGECWYSVITSGITSGQNWTLTWAGSTRPKAFGVFEFTGSEVHASVLDQTVTTIATDSTVALPTGTTGTTTQDDEVAVAIYVLESSEINISAGDGAYTGNLSFDAAVAGKPEGLMQYKILTAAGTQSASATRGAGLFSEMGGLATFKAAGGAAAQRVMAESFQAIPFFK